MSDSIETFKTKANIVAGVVWRFLIRVLLLWAVIVVTRDFVNRAYGILVTVALAAMLTYLVLPGIDFLSCKRIGKFSYRTRRFWATVIVFIALIAVVGIMTRYVVTPFVGEANQFSQNIKHHVRSLESFSQRTSAWYGRLPAVVRNLVGEPEKQKVVDSLSEWLSKLADVTTRSLSLWARNLLHIILIPVLAFYFALDSRSLRREFVGALPKSRRREAVCLLRHVGAILQNYIVGQLILCLIAGVVVGCVLWWMGLDYSLALGVFAGITRAVPIIGPIVSGAVIVLLGLLKDPSIGLWLLVIFCGLHLVESKFILPKLIGHRMRLHPAVILIVLLIGGEFFGIFGMFLAAPVAAIIRELIRFYYIAPRLRREADLS